MTIDRQPQTYLPALAQLDLPGIENTGRTPPTTRYQGSKLKLLPWIWSHIGHLKFDTALDAFGGTASVSYLLKANGKSVTYNDYLSSNQQIGLALIENSHVLLTDDDIETVLQRNNDQHYSNFISNTFNGIYYTDEENNWLDTVVQNIPFLADEYKRAIAYYALFQSCIAKRPYNLFHRSNLYMRMAQVRRGFGNKTTWDKPFLDHFVAFAQTANDAVFDNGVACQSLCGDARQIPGTFDLVYIDTPYINGKGTGVDYFDFYHFLEGIVAYREWPRRVDWTRKHRPMQGGRSPWTDVRSAAKAFEQLFARYADSIIVVSYRDDGTPTIAELQNMLRSVKNEVAVHYYGSYKYVLSTNEVSKEVLLVGR